MVRRAAMILFALCLFVGMIPTSEAASSKDYVALKYAKKVTKVTDTKTKVSGKGILGNEEPNDSTAIIFKDLVSVKNFKATMEFHKDYGGYPQAGWYAINFSDKPTWFSPVKETIKEKAISGVNLIFKLDPTDKKQLVIEISRYTPKAGFKSMSSSIYTTLKKDWIANVELKKGILYIDSKKITDLNDFIDLTLKTDKAFVGFGGFSEDANDVEFSVTYAAKVKKDEIAAYNKKNKAK